MRRKTCALLRAKTSALLRRKTCAVLRARTCALFRANAKEATFAGLLGWLDSLCLLDWLAESPLPFWSGSQTEDI